MDIQGHRTWGNLNGQAKAPEMAPINHKARKMWIERTLQLVLNWQTDWHTLAFLELCLSQKDCPKSRIGLTKRKLMAEVSTIWTFRYNIKQTHHLLNNKAFSMNFPIFRHIPDASQKYETPSSDEHLWSYSGEVSWWWSSKHSSKYLVFTISFQADVSELTWTATFPLAGARVTRPLWWTALYPGPGSTRDQHVGISQEINCS